MTRLSIMTRLLRHAARHDTALLLAVMLLARLTEGIGLLLLVPMLDSLYGDAGAGSTGHGLGENLGHALAAIGLTPTIGTMLILFIALVSLRALLLLTEKVMAMRYQQQLVDHLRQNLFARLLGAEWRWQSAHRASDHAAVLTTGAGRIAMGTNHLVMLAAQMASLIAYGFAALMLSWQITLCAMLGGLAVHAMMRGIRHRAVQIGHDLGDANRAVQASVQEGLAGARLAKILRSETRLAQRFNDVVGELRAGQNAYIRSAGLGQMALQIGGAMLLAALLYGGKIWLALPISVLLTIVLVVARLIPVFAAAQQSYHSWLHATPAIEEFEALLASAARAGEPDAPLDAAPLALREAIRFEGVSVRYAGRDAAALHDVTLTLPALSTTLVTGPSGAGKSTLADLLMGLIEPDAGRVLIDRVPLNGVERQRWRASVAYVQQDCFLFHDTIRANLIWAKPDASEADLEQALHKAAAGFVFALPDGMNTMVGDSGSRLSGGERQRLALARALLGQPALLILDEATSALDGANDALVRQSLSALAGKVTLLVIAHRSDGWDGADQWIEIDAGKASVRPVIPVRKDTTT